MKTTCSTCEYIASNQELEPDRADQWCITCHQQDGCKICLNGRPKPVSEQEELHLQAELLFQTMNDYVQDMSQDIFQQLCEQLKNQLESKLSFTSSNRLVELKIAGKTYETMFKCQIRCKDNETNIDTVKYVETNAQNKNKGVNQSLRKKKRD